MVTNSDEIVPVPFPFKHNEKRTILAFVNDPKLQEVAVESGAEIALGQDVVKKVCILTVSRKMLSCDLMHFEYLKFTDHQRSISN